MKSVFKMLLATGLLAGMTLAQSPEEQELAVLKSDASRNEKVKACHTLGRVGTRAAVAPLAALLDNPELAHAARYGLEMIPDPAVDEAFRAAAGRLNGLLLAGVLQSLGDRRDAASVRRYWSRVKPICVRRYSTVVRWPTPWPTPGCRCLPVGRGNACSRSTGSPD